VNGHLDGVSAVNKGNGALTVTTYGAVTGNNGAGVRVRNYATNYGAAITVKSGSVVKGATYGVYAYSKSQPITITNNGSEGATDLAARMACSASFNAETVSISSMSTPPSARPRIC